MTFHISDMYILPGWYISSLVICYPPRDMSIFVKISSKSLFIYYLCHSVLSSYMESDPCVLLVCDEGQMLTCGLPSATPQTTEDSEGVARVLS